jgi:formylglycine-generating enzyme required for sulfatase activity
MRGETRSFTVLLVCIIGGAFCLFLLLKLPSESSPGGGSNPAEPTTGGLPSEATSATSATSAHETSDGLLPLDSQGDTVQPGTDAVSNMAVQNEAPQVAAATPVKGEDPKQASNDLLKVGAGVARGSNYQQEIALKWVWIPPGSFVMGSPQAETGRRSNEGPQTPVTLTHGFWLGEHEVTLGEFREVTGDAPKHPIPRFGLATDQAFANASWGEAMKFCAALTDRERAAGKLPEGYVYRLPTEAEWEYACRAGTSGSFNFGNGEDETLLDENAWYSGNSSGTPQPVAGKRPNLWGLFDMLGNVEEWCLDYLGTYPGSSVTNPVGVIGGDFFVVRGGSWHTPADWCRSAKRHWVRSGDKLPHIESGFRAALALPVR